MFGFGKKKKAEPEIAKTAAQPVQPKRKSHLETFKIAGFSYHMDEIMELKEPNDDYSLSKKGIVDDGMEDEYIYQYTFPNKPVELVKEPDNPEDKNAIKVMLAGVHIGYIQKSKCKYISGLMAADRIGKMTVDITGGKYKIVRSDENDNGKTVYELDKDEHEYRATLDMSVREVEE